jgi:hypothetical protein
MMDLKAPQNTRPDDHDSEVRPDASARLRLDASSPEDPIPALLEALRDPDTRIGEILGLALRSHEPREAKSGSMGQSSSTSPEPGTKQSLIGNLHPAHVLFFVAGAIIFIVTLPSQEWCISIAILIFLVSGTLFMGNSMRSRHMKLTEAWSKLARDGAAA